jgi:uncharacterized protein YbcC (UPF0753/DUF2309 family)
MTLAQRISMETADQAGLRAAVEGACRRIAPTWPLDQFIAVNPFWGFIDEPLPAAAGQLAALSGARLTMPRRYFREQWQAGRMQDAHLRAAIAETGWGGTVERLVGILQGDDPAPPRRALVTDVVDEGRDLTRAMAYGDFVTHSLSQHCASWFDAGQAQLGPDRSAGLYPTWLRQARQDHSPRLLMGLASFARHVRGLPEDPWALIAQAVETLGVPEEQREPYFTALLLSLNGWAAWCAYLRWQQRLAGADDDHLAHLLAMRLAWEVLLYCGVADPGLPKRWRCAVTRWTSIDVAAPAAQADDWVLQRALEIAYQAPLAAALARQADTTPDAGAAPAVQAVFCIDVRSEPFRRALEGVNPAIRTLGFAGFFGLPIDYVSLGSGVSRPQLPGLLAPRMRVVDACTAAELPARRQGRLDIARAWKQFRTASVSGFSFVEGLGLFYAAKLVTDSLGRSRPVAHPEHAGLTATETARRKPRLAGTVDGAALSADARADLAAGILRAMSLTTGFARLVLLAGHGSQTVNNPHAAGLDCGACCGQTGEVNARALAALLNEPPVRAALPARGITVPDDTWFVAGLHDTTTDEVTLFDLDEVPGSHGEDVARLQAWIAAAGVQARAGRAPALGLAGLDARALQAEVSTRARDWSQVRPEWGLANNAAFVVAPRERCRALDLEGRAFLHDYRWERDEGFGVLELIMTAPMVVTHWINMQYYASTVDNRRYGSGNKVLHNVVGARIGVFEGNGGDLRIGLPMQSLHDGTRWMHTPLRLSVFIEAPRDAMESVLARHPHVRQLVDNAWLYLFQIDTDDRTVHAYRAGGWTPVARASDD